MLLPFASAIRIKDGVFSLEKLSVLLQTKEQSMKEGSDPLMNYALAMFVSQYMYVLHVVKLCGLLIVKICTLF